MSNSQGQRRKGLGRRVDATRHRSRLRLEQLEARETPAVAYGLNAGGTSLVRFDTATPGTLTAVAPVGLVAGDVLAGLDFRPLTGQLYALGFNDAADTVRIYTLTLDAAGTTATASALGPTTAVNAGSNSFGFDFNPVVDRIRVTSNTDE